MLRWCAYCQEFQGEIPPLDKFTTTHGICPACRARGMGQLDSEIDNSHRLREIQGQLYQAGKIGDMAAAPEIVRNALAAGLRPVDILLGLITPLLYIIGIEWETSRITVADEYRFTRFCEHVFELVKLEVKSTPSLDPAVSEPLVFLMNARGNAHNLGIRILSLWLQSAGIETREFHPAPPPDTLLQHITESSPRAVLVSISLVRQRDYVVSIAQSIADLPKPRPTLLVGGYGIKHHLIPHIPGATFVESINGLASLLRNLE